MDAEFLVFLVLPLFGVLLWVGLFWASQKYLPGKSLEGRRVVISLTLQILGRDPSPEELEKGLALWRQSPDAFYRAAEQHLTKDESGYGVSLVDQNGRVISKRSGPLKLVLDPFTIYANWPNQHTIRFNIDRHGFRATITHGTIRYAEGLQAKAGAAIPSVILPTHEPAPPLRRPGRGCRARAGVDDVRLWGVLARLPEDA